jgi:magnesium-transporting ATPase (P-type)
MITGDSALTACHVAKEVGIINDKRPVLILDAHDEVEEAHVTEDSKFRRLKFLVFLVDKLLA